MSLEISLPALEHNYNFYKSLLNTDTKIICVVKANAYGCGSVEVAKLLQKINVDYLAVASTDEGLTLREKGITTPTMIMNPSVEDFRTIINHNLEPSIYSINMLKKWAAFINESSQKNKIHLKIDTGMHRLGFEKEDIELLCKIINTENIKISSIFSHLAAADEKEHDNFTLNQISEFKNIKNKIEYLTSQECNSHVLNSSGVKSFPDYQLDMVRLGISLYGINPAKEDHNLRNVASLYAEVSQLKNIKKGETIGYGRAGIASQDIQIATINIGYADGVSRLLSNGKGEFYINRKRVKSIGTICMDMLMVDVSGVKCEEGDKIELFGKNISILEMAKTLQTIPYEILTSVSERVKRVYLIE